MDSCDANTRMRLRVSLSPEDVDVAVCEVESSDENVVSILIPVRGKHEWHRHRAESSKG